MSSTNEPSSSEADDLVNTLGEAVRASGRPQVKAKQWQNKHGRYDPRRWAWAWWWPMWLWLRWQGYARIWRGDLTPTGAAVGQWTPDLLAGLEGHHIRMFVRKVDQVERPGEIWIKVNGSGWTFLLIFAVIVSLHTWL